MSRAKVSQLSVLAIVPEPEVQTAVRSLIGQSVGELRLVQNSGEARSLLRTWRPSLIVWRLLAPTLNDISLAREITTSSEHAPPQIVYLHRATDVALLAAKLEQLT
jgi:hypothetical protein